MILLLCEPCSESENLYEFEMERKLWVLRMNNQVEWKMIKAELYSIEASMWSFNGVFRRSFMWGCELSERDLREWEDEYQIRVIIKRVNRKLLRVIEEEGMNEDAMNL